MIFDKAHRSFDASAQASELGYAEADPTLDVGGFDARSKLKILIRLAFGLDVDEEDISCRGITELTKIDFGYAKTLGGTIKLLGVAERNERGEVAAFVSPCYVASDDPLASVNGATNAVEVISDNLVKSIYIGQGAGRYPTANSCVNDIVALAKGDQTPLPFNGKTDGARFVNNYESVFFLRLSYRDQVSLATRARLRGMPEITVSPATLRLSTGGHHPRGGGDLRAARGVHPLHSAEPHRASAGIGLRHRDGEGGVCCHRAGDGGH